MIEKSCKAVPGLQLSHSSPNVIKFEFYGCNMECFQTSKYGIAEARRIGAIRWRILQQGSIVSPRAGN